MGKYDDLIQLAGSLPDDIRPEPEKPQALPPTEDERLGIDTPLANPRGILWDPHAREFRHAAGIGTGQPAGVIPERGLVHEDPAMDIATTMAGAGAGKLAGTALEKIGAPVAAKLIEPGVAGAVTSRLQGGDLKQNAIAGGIGAALGIPGAVFHAVKGAPAAVNERLPTAVTGGAKNKAAKQVVAGAPITDMLDAHHPELKKVLATGDLQEKFNATGSTLNKLTSANDAAWDAIQAHHQGVPFDPIADRVKAVADAAHKAGNDTLEDAANAAVENLKRFTDVADKRGPIVSATQLRGIRNNLAKRVQAINPTLGASDVQAAADEIKRAINDGIEEIAGKTPGVDVAALRDRNQQIAQLLPVQRTLRGQVIDKKLLGPEDHLADFIEHPQHVVAGLVRKLPAKVDASLAQNKTLQDFVNGVSPPSVLNRRPVSVADIATRTGTAGIAANAGKPTGKIADEREYTTRVLRALDDGKSMEEAIREAEAR